MQYLENAIGRAVNTSPALKINGKWNLEMEFEIAGHGRN